MDVRILDVMKGSMSLNKGRRGSSGRLEQGQAGRGGVVRGDSSLGRESVLAAGPGRL